MARGNPGVTKLLSNMRKMIQEVNDQEICRRLDILMNTEKEDLPSQMVRRILDEPETFDPSEVPEPYTQYVKHYLYMIKRAQREQMREEQLAREQGVATPPVRKTSTTRKKTTARAKTPVAGKKTAATSSTSTGLRKKTTAAKTTKKAAGKTTAKATKKKTGTTSPRVAKKKKTT